MSKIQDIIRTTQIQLMIRDFLKVALLGIAVVILLYFLAPKWIFLGLLFTALGYGYNYFTTNYKQESIQLLHHKVADTEYSLALLEVENPNIAQQLQLERLSEQLGQERIKVVNFQALWPYGLAIAASALLVYIGSNYTNKKDIPSLFREETEEINTELAPSFVYHKIKLTPPAYSGIKPSESENLNFETLVGSEVQWNVGFSHEKDLKVVLVNNSGKELAFKAQSKSFIYHDKVVQSGLYGIKAYWKDSLVYESPYYTIDAIVDQAPKIEPIAQETYQLHFLNDPKVHIINAQVSDDFMVKEVYLVATLARGSGENVKFREMKFPVSKSSFKSARLSQKLDLKSMNFSPGDELYYYWAAIDNKQPQANFSKSDTYFLVYKDTAALSESELATMAINSVPDYFRSQRQIIIDTEKLIAKQKKMSKSAFQAASNDLGFEQKSLRIRYGQYLGEEYETSIGAAEFDPENPLDGFMHKHDSEEEGHHDHSHHDHKHEKSTEPTSTGDGLADILAAYVHSHDDAESNTYYEESTRSVLKAALEQMWQAELHLRLYEPEKALPYENKALLFLKEAQQKARTFVAKSSYDAPPIKEAELRMKGELKKFNPNYASELKLSKVQLANLASEVGAWVDNKEKLTSKQKQKLMLLSNQVQQQVIMSGLKNWSILTAIRKLINDQALNEEERNHLKKGLIALIGKSDSGHPVNSRNNTLLEKAYWENIR